MFAAFDWNQVLEKAVIGGLMGAMAGGFAHLARKSRTKTQADLEARERARIEAEAGDDKAGTIIGIPVWFFVLVIVAIIVGVLVGKSSLITRHL